MTIDEAIVCLLGWLIFSSLITLILVAALLYKCSRSSSPQEDPLENIHIIGLEARQEMDRAYNDFVLQHVQRLFNSCTNTSYTDTRRR